MRAIKMHSPDFAEIFTTEQIFSRWKSIAQVLNKNNALAELMLQDDNQNGTNSNWVPDKVCFSFNWISWIRNF